MAIGDKPKKLLVTLGKQGDIIKSQIVNKLFEKLEEIRLYHLKNNGFTTSPPSFDTSVTDNNSFATTTYPIKIKEYVTVLESSKYIKNTYHDQIKIPTKDLDFIKAMEYFLDYITVINKLIDIDASCTSESSGSSGGGGSSSGGGCNGVCGLLSQSCTFCAGDTSPSSCPQYNYNTCSSASAGYSSFCTAIQGGVSLNTGSGCSSYGSGCVSNVTCSSVQGGR